MIITDKQAIFIAEIIANHFGFNLSPMTFWDRHYAFADDSIFSIPHNPSLGLLIHELAHIRDINNLIKRDLKAGREFQPPPRYHTKRLLLIIEEMYSFCKANDFFRKIAIES